MFDSYQQRVPKLIVPYNDAKGEIHWFTIIFPIKIEKLIDLRDIGNTVYIYISVYIDIVSILYFQTHLHGFLPGYASMPPLFPFWNLSRQREGKLQCKRLLHNDCDC